MRIRSKARSHADPKRLFSDRDRLPASVRREDCSLSVRGKSGTASAGVVDIHVDNTDAGIQITSVAFLELKTQHDDHNSNDGNIFSL